MPNARITIVPPAGTPFVNPAFAPLCRRFEPLAAFALKAASAKGARTLSWDACQARLDALADEELAAESPSGTTGKEMQDIILKLLKDYQQSWQKKRQQEVER